MIVKKVDIANRAAEELSISGIASEPTVKEISSFIGRLDELAAQLKSDGLDCGYLMPENYGESEPSDDSGLDLWMVRPVAVLLAGDIASSYGPAKLMSFDRSKLTGAMDSLANGLVEIGWSKYPETLPVGQANEYLETDRYFYNGDLPLEG